MAGSQQGKSQRRFPGTLWMGPVCMVLALLQPARAQRLSPLAGPPDWTQLDAYQGTITRDDFTRLLNTIYAPGGAAAGFIDIQPDSAVIKETLMPVKTFTLRFAAPGAAKTPPRYWRAADVLGAPQAAGKPLEGMKIALDPGHLGGRWAKLEERWFQIGNSKPVAEGDMTLVVANLLAAQLGALGATVTLVRDSDEPATPQRPGDLRKAAEDELKRQKLLFIRQNYDGPNDLLKQNSIQWESELLFYRVSEIRHRALAVNDSLKPDLTLCLHFNAEPWGADPAKPELTDKNHMHILLNGCYSADELSCDDIREEMLTRLLQRCADEETALAPVVADSLARATGLPPYIYTSNNAREVGYDPYVWTRNLLASRLYRNPVIYIEAYVMNSKGAFDRIQMGDYDGVRDVDGVSRKSIYREYADAVAEGLAAYFSGARTK